MNLREQSHTGNCARWSIQCSPSVLSLIIYFSLTGFIDCQYKRKEWRGCGSICKNVPVLRHRPFVCFGALSLFHSLMKLYVNGSHFNLEIAIRNNGICSTLPGPSTSLLSWSEAGTHHDEGTSCEEVFLLLELSQHGGFTTFSLQPEVALGVPPPGCC